VKKTTQYAGMVAVIAFWMLAAWSMVPPPQESRAQDWYGPQVTSGLKRFNVDCTTDGNNTIIAAKADTKFRIISLTITSCSTTSDTFYFANGDNELWYSAAIQMTIDLDGGDGPSGSSLDPHSGGHFETDTVNEALILVLDGGEDCNVTGTYVECF
jgi:hypothetical protein